MARRWPNIGPTWRQDGPRRPNIGPRWPQDGPTWAQHGPKTAQHGPTLAPRSPNVTPRWLNPGAGPAPVSSPEAFGGNRRLYTLAAPAGDPPRVDSAPQPTHDYTVIYSVCCVWCSKTSFFTGFRAPRRRRIAPWRC